MNKAPPIPVPPGNISSVFDKAARVKQLLWSSRIPKAPDFKPFDDFEYSIDKAKSAETLDLILSIGKTMEERRIRYGLPKFYIAGGAIRDAVFGTLLNDIDVFVPCQDEDVVSLYTGDEEFFRQETTEYRPDGRVTVSSPFVVLNPELSPVALDDIRAEPQPSWQIIGREDFETGLDLVSSFDYNLTKAYWSPDEGFVFSKDFIEGAVTKTIDVRNDRSLLFQQTHQSKNYTIPWQERNKNKDAFQFAPPSSLSMR